MAIEDTVKDILRKAFGEHINIVKVKSERFTKPGENYGSTMIGFTITLEKENNNKTDKSEKTQLSLIAKGLPPAGFLREVFNVNVTFPKEAAFYENVIPAYSKLYKECYLEKDYTESFPKLIGSKFGPKGELTEESILLMENLKLEGYRTGSKSDGLDLVHSEMVLKELALFHALGIALKLKNPQIFNSVVKNAGRSLKQGQDKTYVEKEIGDFYDQVLDYLGTIPECAELQPRMSAKMKNHFLYIDMSDDYVPREPFCTLVHNDLWLNNIMFNYEETGKPKSLKFLDFQRTKIGTPLSDLLFFLYTSTSLEVMKNKFDNLIKFYHNNLFENLQCLKVASENLDWNHFTQELNEYAPEEIPLPVAMLRILYMKEHHVNLDSINPDSFSNFGDKITDTGRIRHIEVVRDLARRGWI